MNLDLLEAVRRFGRVVTELPGGRIKVEGEAPMDEAELEMWIAGQSLAQCPHCGRYRNWLSH